ncbi:MAG: amidohydrolase [Ruthenibacterium sp.]
MKKLYYGGTILTMEKAPTTDAVLTQDGLIQQVGSFDALHTAAPDAVLIDLAGKTMLPAFIDAHGHFSSYANAQLQVVLEGAESFAEIQKRIAAFILENKIEPDAWIVAKGYDHNTLAEKRHPDKAFLDAVSPKNPLVLQHQSGHCGMLNTSALEKLGFTPETAAPVGGVIGCENGALTGYMEESAYIECIKMVPMADMKTMLDAYRKAQKKYLSYGISTVQEGMMVAQMLPLYKALIESDLLTVDLVGYADTASLHPLAQAFPKALRAYDRHFKIGGYKIILDGSPQVKTAWMKTPYLGGDTCGYGTMDSRDVVAAVEKSAAENVQILAHCNGDAAAQQYLDAIEAVTAQHPNMANLRPVMIHAQFLAKNQLDEVKKLHVIPSFFVAHTLHWGDIHLANLGYDRAKDMSLAQSALAHDILFTFHQDAPVIEPDMLETVQCAVTRTTKSGVVLEENECISVSDALQAVTIHAAYQYFEEESKGSIRAGKSADFVILSDNPLTVPHDEIAKIKVLETIKHGQSVFCAD